MDRYGSRSMSMAGSAELDRRGSEAPATLRQLPGYATPAPTQQPIAAPVVPPTTAGRYQTRERLYYEPLTAETQPNRTSKPQSVVSRLADEAPPAMSIHDVGSLTPERKYVCDNVGGEGGAGEPRSPVRMEVDAAPTMPSEGNWVTVFGFAGAQAASVLAYFKKLGAVEASGLGQGNWMHLQYSTLWAAQKALAKNGTVLAGGFMIGVIPTERAREQVSRAADSFMSPIKGETMQRSGGGGGGGQDVESIFVRPSLMSPASAALQPTRPLAKNIHEMPLPSEDSLVTKALGYVFGW